MVTRLFHLIVPDEWKRVRRVGRITPGPGGPGFVHLSTADLIPLPANRIFGSLGSLLVLEIDPARLTAPVRFEPGVAGDPTEARFPHLYGDLPLDSVVGVHEYRAGPDGTFPAFGGSGPGSGESRPTLAE